MTSVSDICTLSGGQLISARCFPQDVGIDLLQLCHKIGNFRISPYTDTPLPPSWCTTAGLYSLMAVCTSSCWRALLSSCLLATRSQNKQWPTIIFAWSYSTYYNFTGCRWVILSERAAKSRSNTFSHRHTPAWYTKMAAVTWPGDVDLRQLQWVYSIDVLQQTETENTQPADGQFNFIHF